MPNVPRLLLVAYVALAASGETVAQEPTTEGKPYEVVGRRVDARTYNGYRRYHAGCNHCHGQDGLGSTFAPSLVERGLDRMRFRTIVLDGISTGSAVMKGYAADPNVAPYVDDIYAYLRARGDGALAPGRPERLRP
jgi:mono/diheme cytochrome c family protein